MLREIVRLAGRHDMDIRTAIEAHASLDAPILRHAAKRDLIVTDVDRRAGAVLFLGNTAAATLRQSHHPLLFIAE